MNKLGKIIKRGITREEAMVEMIKNDNLVFQEVSSYCPDTYCKYEHAKFLYVYNAGYGEQSTDLVAYGKHFKVNLIDTSKQEVVLETEVKYVVTFGRVYDTYEEAEQFVRENAGRFHIKKEYTTKEVK